jgi:hypothetical protein
MSEIQLSAQLAEGVKAALAAHDAQAQDDIIALQYLAALSGFMLGGQNLPTAQKRELLDQLHAFSKHVLEDMERQAAPPPPQQQQEAFGIWRPGDN